MKKFIAGILVGILMATTVTVFAASGIKTAYFSDTTKLQVDGKPINTEVLFAVKEGQVNGSNYVGARALAEALGATVEWKNDTVVVTSKGYSPTSSTYSYSNPAPVGTMQTLTKEGSLQTYTIETKVVEYLRGADALAQIQSTNMFNDPAPEGYEYILAKIYFKVNKINDGEQFNLSPILFTTVSSDGKDYDYSMVVEPDPSLRANLYEGASNEGWAAFLVKTTDKEPKLAFGRDYNGSGGLWFKLY